MANSLADYYSRNPYAQLGYPFTHPTALAAMARLYGLSPPDPARAKVLEVGCYRGDNLIEIAASLPNARCLGIDLVEDAIARAKRGAAHKGLRNIRFQAADLSRVELGDRRFDYIVAHGVFSWVPDEVRLRLLELCRAHLSPTGVAMISFNTLPGCAWRDALRQLFLLELPEDGDASASPEDQLAATRRVLDLFDRVLPDIATLPHAPVLSRTVASLREKSPQVLLLDEAGPISEPFYLLEVTELAAERGLAYVADTDLRTDWLDYRPSSVRDALAAAGMPRLKALQYSDYLLNQGFRKAILTRVENAPVLRQAPDLDALMGLRVQSRLVDDAGRGSPADPVRVWHVPDAAALGEKHTLEIRDPLPNALLDILKERLSAPPTLGDALAQAAKHIGLAAVEPEESVAICLTVAQCVCRNQMRLLYSR